MSRDRAFRVLAVVAAVVSMSGCATMFRHGHNLTLKDADRGDTVTKIALNLSHATQDLKIYEGDQLLPIVEVEDKIVRNAIANSTKESVARNSCRTQPTCTYQWNEKTSFGPGIFLNPKREHTLRLVRNGKEATVNVSSHIHMRWWWMDGFLGPLCWVGWTVDAKTGMWRGFARLDVDKAFSN
jgi:hypothetical protein